MRENVGLVETDLNMKKRNRGLKRHSSRRRLNKKKRIHSRTSPHMESGCGDIERQQERVAAKQKICKKKEDLLRRWECSRRPLSAAGISRRNIREF